MDTEKTPEVLNLLLDRKIQKEIKKVHPTFNRAELIAAILEEWGGQNSFAKDVYKEFRDAARGSSASKDILKAVMVLICDESKSEKSREVDDMTEEELNRAIIAIAPNLKAYTKEHGDA